jgi:uncharacterized membrane protein
MAEANLKSIAHGSNKMKDTSSKKRLWIALIAGAVGLFLVIVAPLLVQFSLERVLIELLKVVKDRPQFSSGLALFKLFWSAADVADSSEETSFCRFRDVDSYLGR